MYIIKKNIIGILILFIWKTAYTKINNANARYDWREQQKPENFRSQLGF